MECKACIRNRGDECDIFPKLIIRSDTDWGTICRYGKKARHDDQEPKEACEEPTDSDSQRFRPTSQTHKRNGKSLGYSLNEF